ncbi:MAG: hypothetical protein ABJN84_02290 [Flavobacteriaceae bacterium]
MKSKIFEPLNLLYISFFCLIFLSCSKDSDVFAEAFYDKPIDIIEDENQETTNEDDKNVVAEFSPLNDAYIQNVEGYNQTIIRLEEGKRTSYIMFDLTSVDGDILQVDLNITIDIDSGDGTLSVYKGLDSEWDEDNLNSLNAPAIGELLGSIAQNYSAGQTFTIPLNIENLGSEKITLIIIHKGGDDLAIASKENQSAQGPVLVVSHNGTENSEADSTPEVEEEEEEIEDVIDDYIVDCDYGGSCMTPNAACFDSRYPAIEEFVKAGVEGGIPNDLTVVLTISSNDDIQAAIDNVSRSGGGVIVLKNGTYSITETIYMKSNVVLRGESKENVILESTIRNTNVYNEGSIYFGNGISYAGLENLTYFYKVDGCEPQDDISGANLYFYDIYHNDPCGITDIKTSGVVFYKEARNSWIDNCNILESGSHPVRIWGHHITVRNSFISRAYNKGPGGNGYFYVKGTYNLIVNNDIHRLRHLTIDNYGGNYICKYNVIFKNRLLKQDVNFHHGDDGYNLVEQNQIWPADYHHRGGQPVQTGNNDDGHESPGPNNYVYNNDTSQAGVPNYAGEQGVIYSLFGVEDIRATDWPEPSCGTFYPMIGN